MMLVLLIFCGQQGYVIIRDYQKITKRLANVDVKPVKQRKEEKAFALFAAAVRPQNVSTVANAPLSAEIEGIVRSDDPWLSFAVIKTQSGQQSYREGEKLTGYDDVYIESINKDNVVVNYEGMSQVLALKTPDYFKGRVDNDPVTKSTKDAGADHLHLDDYLVLKPLIENGHLEGYNINPRNTSQFYSHSGLEKGDVAVEVNSVDMTKEAQAKNILSNWSKMKEAEVVVRRHAHLENIRINVLNNY